MTASIEAPSSELNTVGASSIRPAVETDEDALVQLGLETGLFSEDEANELLRSSLRRLFDGSSDPTTHAARVATDGAGHPAGWCYLSADPQGPPHVWELWWIGVARQAEGKSYGKALLADAEAVAQAAGATILLISTSSTESTARARAFYERNGYNQVGRIPGYYGEGDDKVTYFKRL